MTRIHGYTDNPYGPGQCAVCGRYIDFGKPQQMIGDEYICPRCNRFVRKEGLMENLIHDVALNECCRLNWEAKTGPDKKMKSLVCPMCNTFLYKDKHGIWRPV